MQVKMISTMHKVMYAIIFIRFHNADSNEFNNFETDYISDLTSLSELPLEKLLILQQKLKHEDPHNINNTSQDSIYETSSFLDKSKENKDRTANDFLYDDHSFQHSLHHDYPTDGENILWLKRKGNVQAIFQTTITVLAFLAFGGYLICIIIATFRGVPQGQVIVQQSTTSTTDNRVVKRSIDINNRFDSRFSHIQSINETYMQALCLLADGYAKYHIITSNLKLNNN